MQLPENVLGVHAARIESEYLERLHKVRFGLDRGWRPPGLMLRGGTTDQRAQAMLRLKALALSDNFFCSYVALGPGLSLRDPQAVSRAAIKAAGFTNPIDASDALTELQRLAATVRDSRRDGWVLLIDNVDRFEGSSRDRALAYRELVRWMGGLRDEQYLGLFCVLAVTENFEQSVASSEYTVVTRDLQNPEDRELLDAAQGGITSLEHELAVHELLVLEW